MMNKEPPNNVHHLNVPVTKGDLKEAINDAVKRVAVHITILLFGIVVGIFISTVNGYNKQMQLLEMAFDTNNVYITDVISRHPKPEKEEE